MEKEEFYGLMFLIIIGLIGEWAIVANFTSKFSQQNKEISAIDQKLTEIHNLYKKQIDQYKYLSSLPGLPLKELNMSKIVLTNDTRKICNNTLLFFSSPSCSNCKDQQKILDSLRIPYVKVCRSLSSKDRGDCLNDNSYLDLKDSDSLVLAYHIEGVPQLLWNCSWVRVGTLAPINETAEFNDLKEKFQVINQS